MRFLAIIFTVLLLMILFASIVFAATDYTCVTDCTNQGYMYGYCTRKCSYPDASTYGQGNKNWTDYSCLTDCTNKGYMYSYCKDYCSY